ncbi:MAG: hypothetical protein ACJ8EY_04495 [Sphingomicrobium sp.]
MFGLYVLLNLATLWLAATVSGSGGRSLWLALLVLGWTVGQFNTLLEGVAFSVLPWTNAMIQLGVSALVLAVLAALALVLSGKWRSSPAEPALLNASLPTLALSIAAYELLYWTAGTMVWPFVAEFYASRSIPPAIQVFLLQIPRALIFIAAAWPWLRTGPRSAPTVLGIAYAVLGGIAPLLPDNPYMSADVRLAHAIETGSSNFLFGVITGYLLTRRRHARAINSPSDEGGVA